jgi:tellurite resistance-related uncharacterized protein
MATELPSGLEHVRTTPTFNEESVPPGLLGAHRIASGVWGRLVVHSGTLILRFEDTPEESHVVHAGEHLAIPPERPHKVELDEGPIAFAIEFHRVPSD